MLAIGPAGVLFNWKTNVNATKKVGIIAQEIESVLPELVSKHGKEKHMLVDYDGLSALLIEALKELKEEKDKEIQGLKDENEALKETILKFQEQIQILIKRMDKMDTK